mmetsp:Transcript_9671/g.31013  ORF Transcript_9671/g.31013 Transcript_9671/m.31013 type:complete len:350 (+) Transcript_9671:84-1133(+)
MKAAVLKGWMGEELEASALGVEELPWAEECGVEDVEIAVVSSSVNPVDWKFCSGKLASRLPVSAFPFVPGMDVAGVVTRTGERATRFKPGDEVWCDAVARNGDRTMRMGAWADRIVVPEFRVGLKPSNLPFEVAGALPLVGLTALQAVRRGGLMPGATAIVLGGSGGVGACVVQIAKSFGAAKIYATCSAANADLVRSLGAEPVDYRAAAWSDVVQRADLVVDTVGEPGTLEKAARVLHPVHGHFVSIVLSRSPSFDKTKLPNAHFIVTNNDDSNDLDELKALCEAGELHVPLHARFPLARLPDALKLSRAGHVVGKIAVDVQPLDHARALASSSVSSPPPASPAASRL